MLEWKQHICEHLLRTKIQEPMLRYPYIEATERHEAEGITAIEALHLLPHHTLLSVAASLKGLYLLKVIMWLSLPILMWRLWGGWLEGDVGKCAEGEPWQLERDGGGVKFMGIFSHVWMSLQLQKFILIRDITDCRTAKMYEDGVFTRSIETNQLDVTLFEGACAWTPTAW
jgi:hypothetical protein